MLFSGVGILLLLLRNGGQMTVGAVRARLSVGRSVWRLGGTKGLAVLVTVPKFAPKRVKEKGVQTADAILDRLRVQTAVCSTILKVSRETLGGGCD